jgi:hypothetical protein
MTDRELNRQPSYNPAELWAGMRLTEAEILIAARFSGEPSAYTDEYESIQGGETLDLTSEANAYRGAQEFKLYLEKVIHGVTPLDGYESSVPPCKIFEATILQSSDELCEIGEEAFGFIFPNNFAVLVDSGPDTDYTNRRIRAGLIMAEAGWPDLD